MYRQIKEKLYCQLVLMLWNDAHGKQREPQAPKNLELLARQAFAEATGPVETRFYRSSFATDAVLLGVGAPVHIFLPGVAKALHTFWRVSEYSSVSNALGAVLGNVRVYETVHIRADYLSLEADSGERAFIVYGAEREAFETLDEAIKRASAIAGRKAKERALKCGAREILSLSYEVKKHSGVTNLGTIQLDAEVTACANGQFLTLHFPISFTIPP